MGLETDRLAKMLREDNERFVGVTKALKKAEEDMLALGMAWTFGAWAFFLLSCGGLWWKGRLDAATLVLTIVVTVFWRKVLVHLYLHKVAQRWMAEIDAKFPKSKGDS
jgi:hypothetical protein